MAVDENERLLHRLRVVRRGDDVLKPDAGLERSDGVGAMHTVELEMHEGEQSEKYSALAPRLAKHSAELLFRCVTSRTDGSPSRSQRSAPGTHTYVRTGWRWSGRETRTGHEGGRAEASKKREFMYETDLQIQERRRSRRYKVQAAREGAERDRGGGDRREKGVVWCIGETGGNFDHEKGGIASMRGIRGGETHPALTATVKVAQSRRGGGQETRLSWLRTPPP